MPKKALKAALALYRIESPNFHVWTCNCANRL